MKIKIKTSDNFSLDAVYNKVEGAKKAVILAHGMTVSKDDEGIFVRAEPKLNEEGFTTLRFDFRAHGESEGKPVKDFTVSGELKDLAAVLNFLKEEGIDRINLAGASFGGSISALFAGLHPNKVNALFLANPVLSYEKCFLDPTTSWAKEYFENVFDRINERGYIEIGSRKFKAGRALFDEMTDYNPCEKLKSYKRPLLVVHGNRDSKVAYRDVEDCFNSLPNKQKELKILEGSEHGFHSEPHETQVVEMIVSFFKKLK